MSFLSKFTKFVGHYANEVSSIGNALSMLLENLPVPRAEKAGVIEAISNLTNIGERINEGLAGITADGVITPEEKTALIAEIVGHVSADLKAIAAKQVSEAIDKAAHALVPGVIAPVPATANFGLDPAAPHYTDVSMTGANIFPASGVGSMIPPAAHTDQSNA